MGADGPRPKRDVPAWLIVIFLLIASGVFVWLLTGPARGARSDMATMRATILDQKALLQRQLDLLQRQYATLDRVLDIQTDMAADADVTRVKASSLDERTAELLRIARQMLAELREINRRLTVLPNR